MIVPAFELFPFSIVELTSTQLSIYLNMYNKQSRSADRNSGFSRGPRKSSGSDRPSFGSRGGQESSRRNSGGRSQGGRRNTVSRGGRGGARKFGTFDPSMFINKNPLEDKVEKYESKHTFKTFGLSKQLEDAISKMGIEIPSPIQDQIIPHILDGSDVVGLAETGTGKTAAFLIPLIEKTIKNPHNRTLILTPTRELAIQIKDELFKLTPGMRIFSTVCVGGAAIYQQITQLKRTNHFIIGTPGRVMDLIERNHIHTDVFTSVVLDEADRMLDMGFIADMRSILGSMQQEKQTLFFSATMSDKTKILVQDFLHKPVMISVKKKDVTNSILQDIVPYKGHYKFETLVGLLEQKEFTRVIIFGSMKHSVEELAHELTAHGIMADSIHGNKTHPQRQRALKGFKEGRVQVLVATDVAARGIHVDDVSHVINYDLPQTFDDYVHRIGRTGRGTKKGKALTFVPSHTH